MKGASRHGNIFLCGFLLHQFSSVAQYCLSLCNPMDCNTPEFPVNHQLPELAQTRVHRVGDAIQPCHPLSSSSPPAFNLFPASGSFPISQFFTWEGQRTGFCFSISPSNEYSGLISFRIDWLDLLAVQRTLKSLLQHQSSEVSILWHSAFFTVQLSHAYVTTGKPIALTRWTFVGKVMSLLFNMLPRFVIVILPMTKCLNIMAAVTICSAFEVQENKGCNCFHCFAT